MRKIVAAAVLIVVVTISFVAYVASTREQEWTPEEIAQLRSLSLADLEPLPADPSNRVADDPRAVALGQRLFFHTRLSSNGKVSCATCHVPNREFQDDKALANGVGTTARCTMPIAGTAYAPFLFWDGRKDSQWAQALGPLESPVEHGGTHAQYARVVASHYRDEYEQLFGPLPDLAGVPLVAGPVADSNAAKAWKSLSDRQRDDVTSIYVNIGKSIAAYERRIPYGQSRFDRYVDALTKQESSRGIDEKAGLRLFIGKANCTQCHNGPLLTNNEFHNTGVPAGASVDHGRMNGARGVLEDQQNRGGTVRPQRSEAAEPECDRGSAARCVPTHAERRHCGCA